MSLDLSTLNKGQTRKLNALRKSLGNEIADNAFAKWMKTQTKENSVQIDPVAEKIKVALSVRRQGFWNRRLLDIAESLAHLLFDIRRLDCGIAIAVD